MAFISSRHCLSTLLQHLRPTLHSKYGKFDCADQLPQIISFLIISHSKDAEFSNWTKAVHAGIINIQTSKEETEP